MFLSQFQKTVKTAFGGVYYESCVVTGSLIIKNDSPWEEKETFEQTVSDTK